MVDFLTQKIVPLALFFLALVPMLALALIGGRLPSLAPAAGGPVLVLALGLVCLLLTAAAGVGFGYVAAKVILKLRRPGPVAVIVGIAAGATMFAPFTGKIAACRQEAAFMRDVAPKVRLFALQHFDEIDSNHDGYLTDGELKQAEDNLEFNAEERSFLALMRAQQAVTGHVVETYTTSAPGTISIGKDPVSQRQVIKHKVYGISRQDLQSYPERIGEIYKRW